jgi:predicted amidophosphoribosyltransferase
MERQLDNNEIPDQILVEYLHEINASPSASPKTPQITPQGQQVCSSCGAPLAAGKTFCTGCGAHIEPAPVQPPKKFCGRCGTEIQSNKTFCPQCGEKTR